MRTDAARFSSVTGLWREAASGIEDRLGPGYRDTATSLNSFGFLLRIQGDLAGARPLFERALAIVEKALGPDHPDTAKSLNNLAGLLRVQGDRAVEAALRARLGNHGEGARPRPSR